MPVERLSRSRYRKHHHRRERRTSPDKMNNSNSNGRYSSQNHLATTDQYRSSGGNGRILSTSTDINYPKEKSIVRWGDGSTNVQDERTIVRRPVRSKQYDENIVPLPIPFLSTSQSVSRFSRRPKLSTPVEGMSFDPFQEPTHDQTPAVPPLVPRINFIQERPFNSNYVFLSYPNPIESDAGNHSAEPNGSTPRIESPSSSQSSSEHSEPNMENNNSSPLGTSSAGLRYAMSELRISTDVPGDVFDHSPPASLDDVTADWRCYKSSPSPERPKSAPPIPMPSDNVRPDLINVLNETNWDNYRRVLEGRQNHLHQSQTPPTSEDSNEASGGE